MNSIIAPWTLHHSDNLVHLRSVPDDTYDALVTDPPYELGFMGRAWDRSGIANSVEFWSEAFRTMKPGAHLVSFGGARTYHRMACAVEDAGFEVRDMLAWVYAQGFPKSLDVSKAIGRCAGDGHPHAVQYDGWGTALKPAQEPIVLARKPLSEDTVAANVLRWGCGAINVDACRVGSEVRTSPGASTSSMGRKTRAELGHRPDDGVGPGSQAKQVVGRWPANLVHDGSEDVLECFPDAPGQQGDLKGHDKPRKSANGCFGGMAPAVDHLARKDDTKSAARFFYCAKADKGDRAGSKHPTVKPVALMRWLCRMVCPAGGLILDPFAGSGTTGQAAVEEGFRVEMIEREDEFAADIRKRMSRG